MKNTHISLIAVLPLVCLTAVLSAAQAKAPEHYRYRGQDAGANYYYVEEAGCVVTTAEIRIWQESATLPQSQKQPMFAFMDATVADICNGFYVSGSTEPYVALPQGAARISPSLKSASLNARFDLVDLDWGTRHTAEVSILWTADGSVERQTHHERRKTQWEILNMYTRGLSRDATVSGSIIFDGADLTAFPEGWRQGWIEKDATGAISTFKLR